MSIMKKTIVKKVKNFVEGIEKLYIEKMLKCNAIRFCVEQIYISTKNNDRRNVISTKRKVFYMILILEILKPIIFRLYSLPQYRSNAVIKNLFFDIIMMEFMFLGLNMIAKMEDEEKKEKIISVLEKVLVPVLMVSAFGVSAIALFTWFLVSLFAII